MNLEQMKARLAEIAARTEEIEKIENLTDEHFTEINTLSTEFDGLKNKVEALEKMQNMKASASASSRKVAPVAPATPVASAVQPAAAKEVKNFGYNRMGNYFMDVATAAGPGAQVSEKLSNAAFEKIGEDGGFLIPTDFRDEIQKKVEGDDSLLPLTRSFSTSSNTMRLPINETAPWDSEGINAYWEGEADTHIKSKSKFKMHDFRLNKLTAYVPVSEELLDDATALQSFLEFEATEAILAKVNSAILVGTGNGMPNGILNSGFKVQIAKELGQASTEILYENIVKMYSAMLPKSRGRGVWIINPQVEEKLRLMKFDKAAPSPVPVFLPAGGLSDSPYATLMGRPIIPMLGATKQLGTEGDIFFVDFQHYYSVLKSGNEQVEQLMSTHVHFDTDLVAFKFRIRMDGNCPFTAPVKSENGNYVMSGLITLQDR